VQDCADFLRGNGFYCGYGKKVEVRNEEKLCYYVSGGTDAWLENNAAEHWHGAIITEPVSVSEMHRWLQQHPGAFIAAISEEIV
jgi:hypothetical protein